MNKSIYYVGENHLEEDKNEIILQILKESVLNDFTKVEYLKLYHLLNSLEFYVISNETYLNQKIKDIPIFMELQKERILTYSVLDEKMNWNFLYEMPGKKENILAYYKRKKVLIDYTNEAILESDWEFLSQMKSFIEEIPCYKYLFLNESLEKKLERKENVTIQTKTY